MLPIVLLTVAVLAGITCNAATQNVSAPRSPREATLAVEDVSLRTPVPVVIDSKERSVRELMEFRVSAPTRFPVRALDPVLVLGQARVTHYRYEDRDRTLVFTSYEPAQLRALAAGNGVDAFVQYGNDDQSVVKLPRFRSGIVKRVSR